MDSRAYGQVAFQLGHDRSRNYLWQRHTRRHACRVCEASPRRRHPLAAVLDPGLGLLRGGAPFRTQSDTHSGSPLPNLDSAGIFSGAHCGGAVFVSTDWLSSGMARGGPRDKPLPGGMAHLPGPGSSHLEARRAGFGRAVFGVGSGFRPAQHTGRRPFSHLRADQRRHSARRPRRRLPGRVVLPRMPGVGVSLSCNYRNRDLHRAQRDKRAALVAAAFGAGLSRRARPDGFAFRGGVFSEMGGVRPKPARGGGDRFNLFPRQYFGLPCGGFLRARGRPNG